MNIKPMKPREEKPLLKSYARPEATREDKEKAKIKAEQLVKQNGIYRLGAILAILCLENIMLVKEIQEHRAALGIKPMEEH